MKKSNMNMRFFLKDSFVYIPSKIIEGIMGIVGLIYYTQWFLPEEYGDFSLVTTVIGFSSTFLLGWLSHSSLRYYGVNQKSSQFISTILILMLIMNVIFIVASGLLMFYIPLIDEYYLYIIILFVLSGMWMIFQSMLRAARKAYVYSTLISVSQTLKFFLTLIQVKFFDVGIQSLFISTIILDIILVIVSLKYLNLLKYFHFKISKELFREILEYGVPLVGVALMSWILQSSDRILLGIMRSSEEVGLYTVAYTIVSQPVSLILTSIMISAFPILINVWEKHGRFETEMTIKDILRYFFILVIPALLGLIMLKEQVFEQVVGSEYFEANKVIPWVSLGLLFMGLTQYTNKVWELTKKTKMVLILTLISGISNILLNILFIPKFGYEAAAFTTFIAYALYYVLSTILGRKHMKIKYNYNSLTKVLFASFIMGIAILLTKQIINSILTLIIFIIMYGIIYLCALFLTKELKEELSMIRSKIKK